MGISDMIARFIDEMIREEGGRAEVQRAELADRFNCVPSQINYVISTRFSPERGYIVESRRGGNGYIRITRVEMERAMLVMHTINAVGEEIDPRTLTALTHNLLQSGVISEKASTLILSATGDAAMRPVPSAAKDTVRASVYKQMLLNAL